MLNKLNFIKEIYQLWRFSTILYCYNFGVMSTFPQVRMYTDECGLVYTRSLYSKYEKFIYSKTFFKFLPKLLPAKYKLCVQLCFQCTLLNLAAWTYLILLKLFIHLQALNGVLYFVNNNILIACFLQRKWRIKYFPRKICHLATQVSRSLFIFDSLLVLLQFHEIAFHS